MENNTHEKKYKILIAEDEAVESELLKQVISKEGYEVLLTKNGQEALDKVEDFNPDLILLDINMPVKNGYDTCRELRLNANTRDIPVLFLTTNQTNEQVMEGFESGAVDYIFKPFSLDKLKERIKKNLEEI